jgi:hypothetical protein
MSLSIQRSSDFSPASVGFSKLRKNKNGGKTVYLNGGDNKKLYLQLPFMRSPYGLSAFTDEGTGRTTYSLDLSFDTDNAEAMEFHDKLKELDEIIVNTVAENSKEWLGKEFNVAVLREALYKPMVRPGKEPYPSTVKLKIATKPDGSLFLKRTVCNVKPSHSTVLRRVKRSWPLLISAPFGSLTTSLVSRSVSNKLFSSNPQSFHLSPSKVSISQKLVKLTRTLKLTRK